MSLLSPGDRWRHTRAVAERAEELGTTLPPSDADVLTTAAWLHDIGYAPALRKTGFHPLDGARYLEERGWPPRLCALVAHHSAARFEAAERGLTRELERFPCEDSPVMDALVVADMTTGPHGERLDFPQRIEEVLTRYPSDSMVHRAISQARETLAEYVQRAEHRVRDGPRILPTQIEH